MAVYIRKLQQGGNVNSPKFQIYDTKVNLKDYTNALIQNFQTFYDSYKGIWNNDQEQEVLRQHEQYINDLNNGRINSYQGPSQSGDYATFVDKIAQITGIYANQAKNKKFTKDSIMKDFYNEFFAGQENPDFQSFLDLDEVVTDETGRQTRGVKNRVNALLNFLNENYLSKYEDADESLGGIENVAFKIDRLRKALADGKLNNEDYAAAAALGFNLRALLQSGVPEQSLLSPQEKMQKELNTWMSRDKGDLLLSLGNNSSIKSNDLLETYFRNDIKKYFEHLTSLAKNLQDNGLDYYNVENLAGTQYLKDVPNGSYIQSMLDAMVNFRNLLGISLRQDKYGVYGIIPESFNPNTGTVLAYYPNNKQIRSIRIWNQKDLLESYYQRAYPELFQEIRRGQYGFRVPESVNQYTEEEQILLQKLNQLQNEVPQEETSEEQTKIPQEEYLNAVPNNWGKKEWAEIGSIAASIASILDPEPFSATGLGLAGTLAHAYNLAGDNDGFTKGDLGNTLLNVGFDIAGAIPVLGDFAQAKKITKAIKTLGAPILGLLGASRIPGAVESAKKIFTDEKLTIQDYRNIAEGLIAVLGAKNYWTNKYRSRALDAAPDFKPQTPIQKSQVEFHNTLRNLGKSNEKPIGWWEQFKKSLNLAEHYRSKFGATTTTTKKQQNSDPIWQTPDWLKNTGSRLKKIVGFKKSGGIILMQNGGWFENFKKRYAQQALTGWDNTKDQSRAGENLKGNGHYNAGSLQEAYNRNVAYINDFDAVGNDLQDYYNSKYSTNSLEDYVNNYNSDIDRLTGHWNVNRTYGSTDARDHNRLFRAMYTRRSSQNSNSPYNIGYQDDIEDIEGSSAWLRRADNYENLWDETSLEDKLKRIHKIKLGNGQEGFVYKENNGKIGIIGDEQVKDLINKYQGTTPESPTSPNIPSTSSGPLVEPSKGQEIKPDNDLWEKITPSLIALQRLYGDINASNKRTKEYLNSLITPSLTPPRFDRQVYGDYALRKNYEDQGAQINSMANRATTSDAKLAFLQRLEGQNEANKLREKGKLADNERIKETAEASSRQAKENVFTSNQVANENRKLSADMARHKAETIAYTDAANRQSIDTYHQNYIEAPITQAIQEHRAYQDLFDNLQLQQNLDYDFDSDYEYQKLVQNYQDALNSGDQASADIAYNKALQYRKSKQQNKYNETLDYFRRMKRLRQRFPYTTVYRP